MSTVFIVIEHDISANCEVVHSVYAHKEDANNRAADLSKSGRYSENITFLVERFNVVR